MPAIILLSSFVNPVEEVSRKKDFVRQFSVMLPNRVGAFSSLTSLLKRRAIDVVGVSMQDSRDASVVRLVLSDPDAAEELFQEKGISFTMSHLVVVRLKESGEGFNRCLMTLHEGETNVDFVYSLVVQHRGHPLLALHLEDAEFGASILNQAGLTVVYENELLV